MGQRGIESGKRLVGGVRGVSRKNTDGGIG